MPLTFPSHPGLILPLWRRFPRRIDGLALCVGAMMPDIIDGLAGAIRGELGHWLGHSLLGVLAAVPPALLLAALFRRIAPRRLIARLEAGAPPGKRYAASAFSVVLGALSHIAFDLMSHYGPPMILWPWRQLERPYPGWWYHPWGSIPLPVYREPYPIAPHTVVWVILTIAGAWLFVRCLRAR